MKTWPQNEQPIILVKQQFQQLFDHSNNEEPLRNQLIIDFPTQMGMRPLEICLLAWQGIDIESGRVIIQDSKSKHLYPLPLSYPIAEKLERYGQTGQEGPVIRRLLGAPYSNRMRDQPLWPETIWHIWRCIVKRAHIKDSKLMNPRLGRHWFAYNWNKAGGNLKVLQTILGHKSLEYTAIYVSRLLSFQDLAVEYHRFRQLPIGGDIPNLYNQQLEQVELREECLSCPAVHVCKHKEELARCEAASGCKFRQKILESALH